VSGKGEPIPLLECKRQLGDFAAFWQDVSHNFTDCQLGFSNIELLQVAAFDEERFQCARGDPVTAIEVA